MNCADKYNLIELCDLIGFGYDLNDTEDGLKFWIMGIVLYKNSLLLTRIQVSDIKGPWALLLLLNTKKKLDTADSSFI